MKRLAVFSWYPADNSSSGERARLQALCRELCKSWDVHLISFSPIEERNEAEMAWGNIRFAPGIPYRYGPLHRLWATTFRESIHVVPLANSRTKRFAGQALATLSPDAILVNQLPPLAVIPSEYRQIAFVDTHNAEYPRLRRKADRVPQGKVLLRLALRDQARLARRLEEKAARDFAGLVAVSTLDEEYFATLEPRRLALVANGAYPPAEARTSMADVSHLRYSEKAIRGLKGLYVGSLSYSANRDAIAELLATWIPETRTLCHVDIVGSGDPGEGLRAAIEKETAVTLVGRVQDISPAYLEHDFLVAPIREAGGTRLKIIEAAFHSLPIIATKVAVEGLGLVDGVHYSACESGAAFAKLMDDYTREPEKFRHQARSAKEHVMQQYSWYTLGARLAQFLSSATPRATTRDDHHA